MSPPCRATRAYERRQPEQTVLYRTIAAYLPTFLARTAGEDGTRGLPAFVRREFEAYLTCGILEGFRLHADVAVPAHRRDQLERVCATSCARRWRWSG